MKCFPILKQTTVTIHISETESFECPMLPVSALGEYKEIAAALTKATDLVEINRMTGRLVNLIKTVFPSELAVERLPFANLLEIANYLMFGTEPVDEEADSKLKKEAEKKR